MPVQSNPASSVVKNSDEQPGQGLRAAYGVTRANSGARAGPFPSAVSRWRRRAGYLPILPFRRPFSAVLL